jgi:transcriptional regulator with XRE-family HTH domain
MELCRRAGDLDARTLTAVEKGRIKNPSLKTLDSIARALEIPVSRIFREAEMAQPSHFYHGTQKGAFQMDWPERGIRLVSFAPLINEFFCGKLILAPRREDLNPFRRSGSIFLSVLVGQFEIRVEAALNVLKEGENVFFNANLEHKIYNPLHRDSALLVVTAPSFLLASKGA